jgi:hypothetical protein
VSAVSAATELAREAAAGSVDELAALPLQATPRETKTDAIRVARREVMAVLVRREVRPRGTGRRTLDP